MSYINEFLRMCLTFIIIMDPLGNIPAFCSVTGGLDDRMRLGILRKAILVAAFVLIVFGIFGRFLLSFFGITPGAFYISGGILFFTISYEMIQSKPRSRSTPASGTEPQDSMMLAVFPLAIPMIAGPGMITTVIFTMANEAFSFVRAAMLLAALAFCLAIQYFVMKFGAMLVRRIGTTGMFVLEKIMGLILAALSIQLIYDGLVKLGILG